MDYQRIGLLISNLRKEKRLTQKELADKLGITDRAVSKWERGLGCPDISLLDDLSRILDVSILEILKGRRLDKDEILNNENIIESMSYSKESFKYKLKKYFNIICISIILIISLILITNNLKSIYYFNKTYEDTYDDSDKQLFTEIEGNIEKIKNNKGIYSDEEYKKILYFVNELEKNMKEENNLYYFNKEKYTYSDIVEFYDSHKESWLIKSARGHIQEIYEIVHNHDSSVVYNIVHYYINTDSLSDNSIKLFKQLKAPYYNGKKIDNEIIVYIKDTIYRENYRNNILLKDIVKVGGIDE